MRAGWSTYIPRLPGGRHRIPTPEGAVLPSSFCDPNRPRIQKRGTVSSGKPEPRRNSIIRICLINGFSHLPQLKVMARTTTFRYKGQDSDAPTIARALKVDAVITGRVTQRGDTLIVQVDLLDAVDGSQVWGERYTRKVTDIFVVQEQIAKEIASRLRLELTGEEQLGLSKRYTGDIGACQNYLQGRSFAQRRTRQDLLTAIG